MILVDAGPLIALFRRNDQHHAACVASLKKIRQPMVTVWPVLAEAMYLLSELPAAQEAIWDMIERGALRILPLGPDDVPRIRELLHTYRDLPMDLADAALIRAAEREGAREFFTIDRKDFAVYRLHGRLRPKLIP